MITTNRLLGGGKRFRDFTDIPAIWITISIKRLVVDESQIKGTSLQLDDANGIFDMQIDDIFAGMEAIGFPPAAGSTAEAHPAPHSPPFSPVRESSPERQPETEWVVPNPVSPDTDWRPWPSVPLEFGPVPRPAGYVGPATSDPIIFGPQPRPYDFVDPALEEPVSFGPPPRPDNYIEPEDIDNLVSMEDDTILGGFHEDSPAGPADAPTPTADAAGRAEDPVLLTSLSAKKYSV
ncbi:hypothetical protein Tco_0269916 [Tanacetum coccineum]